MREIRSKCLLFKLNLLNPASHSFALALTRNRTLRMSTASNGPFHVRLEELEKATMGEVQTGSYEKRVAGLEGELRFSQPPPIAPPIDFLTPAPATVAVGPAAAALAAAVGRARTQAQAAQEAHGMDDPVGQAYKHAALGVQAAQLAQGEEAIRAARAAKVESARASAPGPGPATATAPATAPPVSDPFSDLPAPDLAEPASSSSVHVGNPFDFFDEIEPSKASEPLPSTAAPTTAQAPAAPVRDLRQEMQDLQERATALAQPVRPAAPVRDLRQEMQDLQERATALAQAPAPPAQPEPIPAAPVPVPAQQPTPTPTPAPAPIEPAKLSPQALGKLGLHVFLKHTFTADGASPWQVTVEGGERVKVVDVRSDGWTEVTTGDGRRGLLPSSYLDA